MTEPHACTLDVNGATLHYEVRGSGPALFLVGCPMDASAFAPLAERLAADYTVVTADPRGINRSTVDDRDNDVTPDMLAEDLDALALHLGLGPVMVFGSSGGAVAALAFAQTYPDHVRSLLTSLRSMNYSTTMNSSESKPKTSSPPTYQATNLGLGPSSSPKQTLC